MRRQEDSTAQETARETTQETTQETVDRFAITPNKPQRNLTERQRNEAALDTYEALLEPNGQLNFLEGAPVGATAARRVLVTFLHEAAGDDLALSGGRLSEAALAADWLRSEEDAAWAHLLGSASPAAVSGPVGEQAASKRALKSPQDSV